MTSHMMTSYTGSAPRALARLKQRLGRALAALRLRHARRGSARRERGFNLIEIMVVLTIISMLMGAVGFGAFAILERARKKETRNVMKTVENAMTMWQMENTTDPCPPNLSELAKKANLSKEPKDAWGRPFVFKCPGDHGTEIDLTSLGKDGREGTPDDIKSWEEDK